MKLHLRAMNAAFDALETDFRLEDRTTVRALEVSMRNGSRVTALPANPDTARGFSANVFWTNSPFIRTAMPSGKPFFR